jgi:hypothetical protein
MVKLSTPTANRTFLVPWQHLNDEILENASVQCQSTFVPIYTDGSKTEEGVGCLTDSLSTISAIQSNNKKTPHPKNHHTCMMV